MVLKLRDGYTLKGKTSGLGNAGEPQPVISFDYRPPLAPTLAAFRYSLNAARSGEAEHEARCKYLLERLADWDVIDANDRPAPITVASLSMLPDPIFLDLVNECSKWRPLAEEVAAKN